MASVPWPEENGIWHTYDLHCHCGAIRYKMTISPPLLESESQGKGTYTAILCDCSSCQRNGTIACHPRAKNVEFRQGLEHRATYLTGSKKNPHWFCKLCGSTLGADLSWLMENVFHDESRNTINLRMLKDVELKQLTTREMNYMKSVGPKYSID